MAFNFSAMQYESDFQAKRNCNWEYPRFFPPRPCSLKPNSTPLADKNGHLLPTARREGNFLGNYRGTYHLPLRITRSFISLYDSCLSGHHKFSKYPRNLCSCHRERPRTCDFRETLGDKNDPQWKRPKCQTKCEGLQHMLDISECKRVKCQPQLTEKLVPRVGDASSRYGKKLRKRPVTAFECNRQPAGKAKADAKDSAKEADKEPSMDPPSKEPYGESALKEAPTSSAALPRRSKSSTKNNAQQKLTH